MSVEIENAVREIKEITEAAAKTHKDDVQKLEKLYADFEKRIDTVETKLNRPVETVSEEVTDKEYQKAFNDYCRKGVVSPVLAKGLSSAADADGKVTVVPEMDRTIRNALLAVSPIRNYANVMEIGSGSVDVITHDSAVTAAWVAETAARPATADGAFGKVNIIAEELYCNPEITQRLLDDSSFDLEAWLTKQIADNMGKTEGTAFINGTGSGQPQGLFLSTNGITRVVTATASVAPVYQDILDLIGDLPSQYDANAKMIMSKKMFMILAGIKNSVGDPIWREPISGGQPFAILGYPVVFCDDCVTAIADNANVCALVNLKEAYQIVDKAGVTVIRDPYVNKPYVQFYTVKRVGGAVVNANAARILKIKAAG